MRHLFPRLSATALVLLAVGPALAAGFDHAAWDGLLHKYVNPQGQVAYKQLAAADKATLLGYLDRVAAADITSMGTKERLAFYINAYNALVWKGILEGGSPESTFSRVKFFGFGKHRVAGVDHSLKKLEDEILRAQFKDPRVHFALVCAATSCPPLLAEAYLPEKLDEQLDAKGRQFMADTARNPLGAGPSGVKVSKIFDWFESDFTAAAGSVSKFLAKFAPSGAAACFAQGDCKFEYVDYDWTMNAQPGQRP